MKNKKGLDLDIPIENTPLELEDLNIKK